MAETVFDPSVYQDEAERRWGTNPEYQESMRRTRRYGDDDWAAIRTESESVTAGMAALLAEGTAPDEDAAMDLAEAHRRHIERWFYPCSHALHAGLAAMYTDDPRFSAYFDARGAGLATFVRDAIVANAVRYADKGDL